LCNVNHTQIRCQKFVKSKKIVEYQIDIGTDGSGMPFALFIGRMHANASRTMAKGGVEKEKLRIDPVWIVKQANQKKIIKTLRS
jgi:hypothetical protein